MKWEDQALEVLRSEFRNRIFSAKDALKVLYKKRGYSKGTVYRILHDLCKRGLARAHSEPTPSLKQMIEEMRISLTAMFA